MQTNKKMFTRNVTSYQKLYRRTLRAHSMGLSNYPSSESQIPPQMGRTYFPPFSEWKAESA